MKFGLGPITGQILPSEGKSVGDSYRETLEVITRADDLGFDSCWLSEHHFLSDGHISAPLSVASAVAAQTSRITLGTGLLLAPFHNPLALAEEAATVDQLSEGRLILGLGMGYRDAEFKGFGVSKSERVPLLKDSVAFMKQAWNSKPASIDGNFYSYQNLDVHPKPHRDPRPPIWIGATSKAAIERAARIGDNWIIAQFHSLEDIAKRISTYKRASGSPPSAFPLMRHCFVSEDGAWETAKEGIKYMEKQHFEWVDREWSEQRLQSIKQKGIFGTPEEVTVQLQQYQDEIDEDIHFILWFNYPGVETANVVDSMTLFADEVIPELCP